VCNTCHPAEVANLLSTYEREVFAGASTLPQAIATVPAIQQLEQRSLLHKKLFRFAARVLRLWLVLGNKFGGNRVGRRSEDFLEKIQRNGWANVL